MTDHSAAYTFGHAAFIAHLKRDSSLDIAFQDYLRTKRDPDAVSAAWLEWLQGWDAAQANAITQAEQAKRISRKPRARVRHE